MLTTYYGNETIAALFRISIPSVHCAMFGNLHNTVQRVNNLYGLLITEKTRTILYRHIFTQSFTMV